MDKLRKLMTGKSFISELPTHIIAFAGIAIWFVNLERPVSTMRQDVLLFALVITSFSPSDLFPGYVRAYYIVPYALKALSCFLIWQHITYETLIRKFTERSGSLIPIAYAKENFDYYPSL